MEKNALKKGDFVEVKRFVAACEGFAPHSRICPVETWKPASFECWDEGRPIVKWPNGQFEKLLYAGDVR